MGRPEEESKVPRPNKNFNKGGSGLPNLSGGFGDAGITPGGPDEYVHDPYAGYDKAVPSGSESSDGDEGYKNMNQDNVKGGGDANGFEDIFGNPTRPSHNGPATTTN